MSKKPRPGKGYRSMQYPSCGTWAKAQKAWRRCERNLKWRTMAKKSPLKCGGWRTPRTIRERRQKGEIAASLVVVGVKGSMAAEVLLKKTIKTAGVWFRVEAYTNEGPVSRCERCC
jgi:hypothetical protein